MPKYYILYMAFILKKLISIRHLYLQLMITALSFLAMVVLSHILMRSIVQEHINRNTESAISIVQSQIDSELIEIRVNLSGFSRSVRNMILRGENISQIRNYYEDITDHFLFNNEQNISFSSLFGYFEVFKDESAGPEDYLYNLSDNFSIINEPWYKNTIAAKGEITETLSIVDPVLKEPALIFAQAIYSSKGCFLGIIGLRLKIKSIGMNVVHTALAPGGYGILLSEDLVILAHPDSKNIGVYLGDPSLPASQRIINYTDEETIIFFRTLPNGWHLGLVTPKGPYYKSITKMLMILSLLGLACAAGLAFILIRIDAAKTKSDMESRHKSAFLANMSHEIRTPMNAIIGMTAVGKSASDTERKDYCFLTIEDASNHLLGVINDILDMSKIEANKLELSPEEFSFEKMLQQVVNVINFRVDEKINHIYNLLEHFQN